MVIQPLRMIASTLVVTVLVAFFTSQVVWAETALTIYTTTQSERLSKFREQIEKDLPDIKVNWVRDSTGIITAKILAEKEKTPADAIIGVASTSIIQIDRAGLLLPYTPKYWDKMDRRFRDRNNPPHWNGVYAYVAAICYNTVEAEKRNLPKPSAWKDLLDPVYKGHIVMPNPASSGTGLITVSGWLQTFGEEKAWSFMDKLHDNIAMYTHSGSKPCVLSAQGEFPIGISFASRGAREKGKGGPLEIILPEEGVGWAMSSVAVVKTSKNLDAAKRFVDWATGESANNLYNIDWAVLARPEFAKKVPHYPDNASARMIDNDFYWEADNRGRVIEEWGKRYASKSEPKKKKK